MSEFKKECKISEEIWKCSIELVIKEMPRDLRVYELNHWYPFRMHLGEMQRAIKMSIATDPGTHLLENR